MSLALAGILCGCARSVNLLSKTVSPSNENILFAPENVTRQNVEGIAITITPVDAAFLNQLTFDAARRDGAYEQLYFATIQHRQRGLSKLGRGERRRIEAMLKVTEELKIEEPFPPIFNPYRVKDNYLSVFKVRLDNRTLELASLSIEEFQVSLF